MGHSLELFGGKNKKKSPFKKVKGQNIWSHTMSCWINKSGMGCII